MLTLHMFCVCRWTMHLQSDAEQQNDTARKSAVALMAAAAYRRPLQVAQISLGSHAARQAAVGCWFWTGSECFHAANNRCVTKPEDKYQAIWSSKRFKSEVATKSQ